MVNLSQLSLLNLLLFPIIQPSTLLQNVPLTVGPLLLPAVALKKITFTDKHSLAKGENIHVLKHIELAATKSSSIAIGYQAM